jgi:hypothetical protein
VGGNGNKRKSRPRFCSNRRSNPKVIFVWKLTLCLVFREKSTTEKKEINANEIKKKQSCNGADFETTQSAKG